MWKRVAEDFAPFDVNVTTSDPGNDALVRTAIDDQLYGSRVVITLDAVTRGTCNCGGQAYIDVFDTVDRCGYIAEWTAVKLRWRLTVDRSEAQALRRIAATCPATRLTVVRT